MDLMRMPHEERDRILSGLREEYPGGTEVEVVEINDPYTHLKPGTKGRVRTVDDAGTIHVNWENRSSLGAVYGEDKIAKVKK